ncbi:MAG TPA: hypothetical protein VHQ70_10245, partial [Syntrophomonadaceae bacterium]|nr:hypothetical protein [Syntrophomonadaceae bacterium]
MWTLGIFATLTFLWYMSCYSIQKSLDLKDLRLIATPGSIIMGIVTVMLSSNVIELRFLYTRVFPIFHFFFFVIIPIIMAMVLAFKPTPATGSGLTNPIENS